MLLQRRQPDEAMALFDKALLQDPSLIQVHQLRAKIRKEQKDEGTFHEEMASYFEKLDRADDALKHLKEALKLYGESTPKGEEVVRRMEIIKSS
jgi:tetratricopeptide (TPR) repeat protein